MFSFFMRKNKSNLCKAILRCPFCGWIPNLKKKHLNENWIECECCGIISPLFQSMEEAIKWWNKRAAYKIIDDLANCPFCGKFPDNIDHYSVGCSYCLFVRPKNSEYEIQVLGGYNDKYIKTAIEKWNHRFNNNFF